MSDAKLHIKGPYDNSGNKQGPDLDFYLTQEADDNAETDTKPRDIPTQDDSETLVAPIQGQRDIRWKGRAVGTRLHRAGFGSDPRDALITWLIQAESLVSSQQGAGFKVIDDERGETYDPTNREPGILINNFNWTYEAGKNVSAEWNLEGKVTEGMQQAKDRNRYIDTELLNRPTINSDSIEEANGSLTFPLGELTSRTYDRSIDLNVSDMVHQTDVPTTGLASTGVQGELQLEGRLTRDDTDNLQEAARQIVDDFHGRQVVFRDSFTGREFEGAISDSSTGLVSGRPDILDYRVEIRVGTVAASAQ